MDTSVAAFHFMRPWWLLALIPCALLALRYARQHHPSAAWRELIDPALLEKLLLPQTGTRSRALPLLLFTGWLLGVLALAGPSWERLPEPAQRSQDALIIALGLDASMYATDVAPSRLQRARHKISDILATRHDGLTALIVYAGDAHVVTPLSDDTATIAALLGVLDPAIMPEPGNDPAAAASLAARLLRNAGLHEGRMLFIADAFPHASQPAVANTLENAGLDFSLLGVGTERGAPAPLPQGGFLRDARGAILVRGLDTATMRDAARAAGGRFAVLGIGDGDLQQLLPATSPARLHDGNTSERRFDQWQDRAPWLALALLPLAALAFRRGWLLAIAWVVVLPVPHAQALEWHDLWLRRDQQGEKALAAGEAERAARLFRNPAWRGAAQYEAKDYEGAAASWATRDDAEAHYNRGNALARAGRLDEAISAYDAALERDPRLTDAALNRRLVEELARRQESHPAPGNSGRDPEQAGKDENRNEEGGNQPGQDATRPDRDDTSQQPSAPQQQPDTNTGGETDDTGNPPPHDAGHDEDQQARDDGQTTADATQQEPADPSTSGASVPRESPPENGDAPDEAERPDAISAGTMQADPIGDEEEQARENWLRRIHDDPGELLRRKFDYENRQRQERSPKSKW